MPPAPLQAVTAAAVNARFHCLRSSKSARHALSLSKVDLPSDVVRLVGIEGRPVRDVGSRGKKRADVSDSDLICEAQHAEAYNEAEAVEDYHGTSDSVFVADDG